MNPTDLIAAAAAARNHAYCPYSHYHVGAAVLTDNEIVFSGCNVENASYGLTLCAERVALSSAVAAGHTRFAAIAIVADDGRDPFPCGACRQVLAEFCSPQCRVYIAEASALDRYKTLSLDSLLPHAFTLDASRA